MATTPTNNAVPSESPRDLKFNAGKIDEFVTSQGWTYTDRFGVKHYTIEGINNLAQEVMSAFGYVTLPGVTFTTGATVSNPNEVLFNTADNSYYKWTGSFSAGDKVVPPNSTPESTGGVGPGKWLNVGDSALRSQLAAAGGVNLVNGAAHIEDVERLLSQNSAFVYIDDYKSLAADGDWTNAINSALATGKTVVGSGPYNVKGIIKSSGQRIVGEFIINASRYSFGDIKISTSEPDLTYFKGMYVESAYDLCELMYIKNIGINTVLHYGNFAASSQDADGTIQKVLDNCQTAGIRCIVGTEAGEAGIDLNSFIDKYRNHPALLGWTAYDEPMSRGISYAAQREKVDLIRVRTSKPIAVVDAWYGTDVISPLIIDDYDIVFADPYSVRRSSGTLSERVAADLDRMRRSHGGMQAHSRSKNVIPVIGAFTTSSGAGTSDVQQILGAAETYMKSGNGSFACFVWDGAGDKTITSGVRGKPDFLSLIRSACQIKYQVKYETESFVFGGNNIISHQPLNFIIDRIVQKDSSTTDTFMGINSYPVQVITDTSESDRSTTEPGWNVSGIGFKSTIGTLVTNIKIRKNLLLYGEYNTILGNVNGTVSLLGSYDGGYSLLQRGAQNVNGKSAVIDMSITTPNQNERLCIRTSAAIDSNYYRRFIKGLIVSTDW